MCVYACVDLSLVIGSMPWSFLERLSPILPYSAGMTSKVNTVEVISPPMTTVARGRWTRGCDLPHPPIECRLRNAQFPRHLALARPTAPTQVHRFLLNLRRETPSRLAHEAPPFADYARKVSTKSGEDQGLHKT